MWKRRAAALLIGAALVIGLVTLRAADPYPVRVMRETIFDTFQQIRPRPAPAGLPLRILAIDEASLAAIGQWPWSRTTMTTIVDRLTDLGAAAIAFDVLFSEPDRSGRSGETAGADAGFAAALAGRPTILVSSRSELGAPAPAPKAGYAMTGGETLAHLPTLDGVSAPLPDLLRAAAGLGIASLDADGASIARRLPLLWSNDTAPLPTLAIETLRVAQGLSTLVVTADAAGAVESVRIGQVAVPTGPSGDMWLYYRTLEPQTYVSAQHLLSDDYAALAPALSGHVVLVGATAAGLLDIRSSALGAAVPGVSIHFQALEQMLTGTFLQRADWVSGLEILLTAASILAIFAAVLLAGPWLGLAVSLAVLGANATGSWLAFAQYGVLLDPGFVSLAALFTYAATSFYQFAAADRDRRRIRRAFAHYVEPSLLRQIEGDAGLLKLGGDLRDLTVMFSDIRNFAALSERTEPAGLVDMLNRLFAALGTAIIGHSGTIDKFMGDAVMAFWNAPVDVPDHPRKACLAALEMRSALARLNSETADAAPIAIGIGIATGPALVGNMGFEARFDYSCIGETVNLASRLEGSCRRVGYDILVTEEIRSAAPELAFLPAGRLALKGISEPEPIHLLVGDAGLAQSAGFAALQADHDALLAAWGAGGPAEAVLIRCRSAASDIAPRLVAFYDAAMARPEDFSNGAYSASEGAALRSQSV